MMTAACQACNGARPMTSALCPPPHAAAAHQVLLKALYSRYRLKPPGGGMRTRTVRLEGWLQLLTDARLVDQQFTIQVGFSVCCSVYSTGEVVPKTRRQCMLHGAPHLLGCMGGCGGLMRCGLLGAG